MRHAVLFLILSSLAALPAAGQRVEKLPPQFEGVGTVEHLGERVPLDLTFIDENGREVKLGNYFGGNRPVILNLGYYRCPMLCSLILNGLVDGLKGLPWTPGRDFEIVTVSIDPLETPRLAQLKKDNYISNYGRPEAAMGWHFLTGREPQIQELADRVGFHFKWNDERQEFAHPAVLFVVTPDGRLSRYLYGVQFDTQTVRLALTEASEGKLGNTVDKILLFCYHYDSTSGKYTLTALTLMRLGGIFTALVLGSGVLVLWRRERRRRVSAPERSS